MDREEVRKRIREERKRLGWTQEQLAEVLGKNKSFISRMEVRGQHISIDILEELADVFRCSIDFLLCRTDKRN